MKVRLKAGCPRCFKALSSETGIGIVDLLAKKREMPVGEIASHFKLSQPTVSYHLSKLTQVGILESRCQGRFVYYKLRERCPYDEKSCIIL